MSTIIWPDNDAGVLDRDPTDPAGDCAGGRLPYALPGRGRDWEPAALGGLDTGACLLVPSAFASSELKLSWKQQPLTSINQILVQQDTISIGLYLQQPADRWTQQLRLFSLKSTVSYCGILHKQTHQLLLNVLSYEAGISWIHSSANFIQILQFLIHYLTFLFMTVFVINSMQCRVQWGGGYLEFCAPFCFQC